MAAFLPESVTDARLSHALSCWQRWRGSHACPARSDVEPADLDSLLPNLFMADLLADGRIRYTLAGRTVRDQLGFELTGLHADELFAGGDLDRINRIYGELRGGNGHVSVQRWLRQGEPVMRFRSLLLPLATDRRRPDSMLGFALYERLDGRPHEPIDHIRNPVTIEIEQDTKLQFV